MIKNIKHSKQFETQLAVLGKVVNNKSLVKRDPSVKKKVDTEKIFIKSNTNNKSNKSKR